MQTQPRKHLSSIKSEFWSGHIRAWKESGLKKSEYCRQNGLSRHAFYYWQKKLDRSNGSDNTVVPLSFMVQATGTKEKTLSLNIGQRFQIDIQDDFNCEVLKKLINTLESIS